MTDLKTAIDSELNTIKLAATEEEIIKTAKRKPAFSPLLPRVAAAVLVLVLLCGICFLPNLLWNDSIIPVSILLISLFDKNLSAFL